MPAYYNEIDPYAAQWIRNLITAGHIADGIVDERSIEDVHPIELREFTQCHFFAGIGVWSRALRIAGWSDDRTVWTGSCPCQPFSAAGKGAGFDDERHLWPAFHHLIAECRPAVVFGEQVASKDADPWIDLVQADLEALGYSFGAIPFPSAGIGAPHIRDRLYWVADAAHHRQHGGRNARTGGRAEYPVGGAAHGLDHTDDARLEGHGRGHQTTGGWQPAIGPTWQAGELGGLADGHDDGLDRFAGLRLQRPHLHDVDGRSPVSGFWADADWLPCRDNKWRPVEPGTFPLAHGAANRVGRLRAYGNAINAVQAQVFVEAYLNR